MHRNHAAPVGGGRLLLHALPSDSTVSPPTVTDWLWLVSYPILYAGTPSCVHGPCIRPQPLATRRWLRSRWPQSGAAVLFGAVVEHGRVAADRSDEPRIPVGGCPVVGLVVAVAITGWQLDQAWLCILAARLSRARGRRIRPLQGCGRLGDSIKLLDAGWPLRYSSSLPPPGGRRRLGAVAPRATRPGAARDLRTHLAGDPRPRTDQPRTSLQPSLPRPRCSP